MIYTEGTKVVYTSDTRKRPTICPSNVFEPLPVQNDHRPATGHFPNPARREVSGETKRDSKVIRTGFSSRARPRLRGGVTAAGIALEERTSGGRAFLFAFALYPRPSFSLDLGNFLPFFPGFRTGATDIVQAFQRSGLFFTTQILEPRPRTDEDLVQLDGHHEESGHTNDNAPLPC